MRLEGYPRVRLAAPNGTEIEAAIADGFGRRLKGLAWLRTPPRTALLIPRCASVHTIGMRFPIDVAFLEWPPRDRGRVPVIAVREHVKPLRLAGVPRRGRIAPVSRIAALELASETAVALGLGPGIELREA